MYDTTIKAWVRRCEYRKVNQQEKDWLAIRENDPGDLFGYIYTALNWTETGANINTESTEVATIAPEADGFQLLQCSQVIPNCLACDSKTACNVCEAGYRLAEMVPTPGFSSSGQLLRRCLYNSCGYVEKTRNDENCG